MYKYLSRIEPYQIHSLLKANQPTSEIDRLLGRHRTPSAANVGGVASSYRAEHAYAKAFELAWRSSNANRVDRAIWSDVAFFLCLEWSLEQIAAKFDFSCLSVYQRVYTNKAA